MRSMRFHLIEDNKQLSSAVIELGSHEYIAIDTEFMRTNTLYAQPGLIQVAHTGANYLIDPLAVNNLEEISALLSSPDILKIMHSMSEDLELLYHISGVRIRRVFDTQIAAAFMGKGVSLGYQRLVSDVLNIELDKSETRSDWLQRPLSSSQLDYAARDVDYLLEIYEALDKGLREKGFLDAVMEESERMVSSAYDTWEHPELAYLKLRGGCELKVANQCLLKDLVIWRDSIAKNKDIPKPWVFNDNNLIQIADVMPANVNDLRRLKGIQHKSIKRFGEQVIELVSDFRFDEVDTDTFALIDKPVRGRELDIYQRLKSYVAKVSKQTGIETQLLSSRKMLESLVITVKRKKFKELPNEYLGWRKPFLAKGFAEILEI